MPIIAQRQGQIDLISLLNPLICFPSIYSPTISLQQLSNLVPKYGSIVQMIAPFKAAHFPPFPLSKLQKFSAQVPLLLTNDTQSFTKSMRVLISSEQYLSVINLGCALSIELTKQWMPVLKYYWRMSAQRYSQKWSLSLLSIMLSMRQCYITSLVFYTDLASQSITNPKQIQPAVIQNYLLPFKHSACMVVGYSQTKIAPCKSISIDCNIIKMEIAISTEITGWTALTNYSCFITHAELKKSFSIFGQLDAWLDYLEYLIRVEMHKADQSRLKNKKRKKELTQELVVALKSLKSDERIYYYNTMVELVQNLIRNELSPPHIQNSSFLIIQSYTRSYNLKIWKQKKLRFDRQNHIIYAQRDKKIKIYDLGNYIVRRSNNTDYFCIVLEAVNSAPLEKSKTVHIGFEFKNSYSLWFCSIQNSVKYKLWEKLGEMLGKKSLMKEYSIKEYKQSLSKSTSEEHPHPQFKKSESFYSQPATHPKNNLVHTQTNMNSAHSIDERYINPSLHTSVQTSQYSSTFKTFDESPTSKDEELTLLRQTFTNRLLNENMESSLQQLHCECQRESEASKLKKKTLNIHRILLQSYRLSQIDNTHNFHQLSQQNRPVQPQRQFRILQQNNSPLNFKLIYITPNKSHLTAQSVLRYFLQPKQSQNFTAIKAQIKCVVLSQNITINLEELTSYNRLYRPREFVYVRYLVSDTAQNYYIIDRSIEQPIIKRRQNFVRAHLFRITKLHINSQHIKVTVDFTMRFNGELRSQQELNHSKRYIQNLQQFLSIITRMQQKHSHVIFYDCQRKLTEQQTNNDNEDDYKSMNVSISEFQNDSFLKPELSIKKETSFYHIPRNFLQSSHTNESLLQMGEQPNTLSHFNSSNRNTYSPPRKYCKDDIIPKLSFLKEIQQKVEPTIILPLWSSEWQVDEQRGGLTQQSNNPKQKKIFKEILQNVSRFTLIGKDPSRIAYPVQILATESTLQRKVKTLAYAPYIFDNIDQMSPLSKLKKTIVLGISISLLSLYIQKPFTAHLGQTFQAKMSNDCMVYAQELSTNPQTSGLLLLGKQYSISACIESKLQVMLNSICGQNKGTYSVQFKDGARVDFTLPVRQLAGLCFDERTYKLLGRSHYWLEKDCLFLELNFEINGQFSDSSAKIDYFEGSICQVSPQAMSNFILHKLKPSEKDILRRIEKISGRWTKSITFEDHTVDLKTLSISNLLNEPYALESDSTFRTDINELKTGNPVLSQQLQLQLSTQQRKNEQLRRTHCATLPKR